eukprot:359374-Chlamydomonas_euryale.AAC.6
MSDGNLRIFLNLYDLLGCVRPCGRGFAGTRSEGCCMAVPVRGACPLPALEGVAMWRPARHVHPRVGEDWPPMLLATGDVVAVAIHASAPRRRHRGSEASSWAIRDPHLPVRHRAAVAGLSPAPACGGAGWADRSPNPNSGSAQRMCVAGETAPSQRRGAAALGVARSNRSRILCVPRAVTRRALHAAATVAVHRCGLAFHTRSSMCAHAWCTSVNTAQATHACHSRMHNLHCGPAHSAHTRAASRPLSCVPLEAVVLRSTCRALRRVASHRGGRTDARCRTLACALHASRSGYSGGIACIHCLPPAPDRRLLPPAFRAPLGASARRAALPSAIRAIDPHCAIARAAIAKAASVLAATVDRAASAAAIAARRTRAAADAARGADRGRCEA